MEVVIDEHTKQVGGVDRIRGALEAFEPPTDAAADTRLGSLSAQEMTARVVAALLDPDPDPVAVFAHLAADVARQSNDEAVE